jgi:hypothetical protein
MFGCCGNHCSQCGAYLATQADDDAKRREVAREWTVEYNTPFSPEQINCVGCTAEGVHIGFTENICAIRKCCMGKGHPTCADCASYPCDELSTFLERIPEAKANLERLRE